MSGIVKLKEKNNRRQGYLPGILCAKDSMLHIQKSYWLAIIVVGCREVLKDLKTKMHFLAP